MDIEMEEYRQQFYQEAREILDQVNEDILRAEQEPENEELLNSIFRGVHTIKGSAGGFELDELSQFAHHLEGILNQVRDGRIVLSSELVDLVLKGLDSMTAMILAYEQGEPVEEDSALVQELISFIQLKGAGETTEEKRLGSPPGGDVPSGLEQDECSSEQQNGGQSWQALVPAEHREMIQDNLGKGASLYQIKVRYSSDELANGFDPLIFLKNIHEDSLYYQAGTSLSEFPDFESFDPFTLYLQPCLVVLSFLSSAEVADLAFDPALIEVEVLAKGKSREVKQEEIAEDMLPDFLADARQHLEIMETRILDYEQGGDQEALQDIFRAVHTLKGDAGYLNLKTLSSFCHVLESVLEQLRQNRLKRDAQVIDLILRSGDYVKSVLTDLEAGKRSFSLPGFLSQLEELALQGSNRQESEEGPVFDQRMEVFVEQAQEYQGLLQEYLDNPPSPGDKLVLRCLSGLARSARYVGLSALHALAQQALDLVTQGKLQEVPGKLREVDDFLAALSQGPKRLGEILQDEGKLDQEDLEEALNKQKPLGEILVAQGKVAAQDVDKALQKQKLMDVAARKKASTGRGEEPRVIRVDERKIDHFSNLIGELIVAKNSYDYLLQKMTRSTGDGGGEFLKLLKENLYLFARIVNGLQEGVLSIRMVPVKGVFQKFNRVVRDISRKQDKDIQLVMDGEETEVDKKVADMLSDPLIHLVRNACDHGLETRVERERQGKPSQGVVILRAYQEGRDIIIKVIDDGRGIDPKKIHAKALERGITPPDPSDPRILDLIFEPAFSTAEQVTDVSGRGVGMDVVKTAVESLGGKVQVQSDLGEGTEVTLAIPMSIGICTVLMLEEKGQQYGLPIENVAETFKVSPVALRRLNGSYGLSVRGEILPVETLEQVLDGNTDSLLAGWYRKKHDLSDLELPVVVMQTRKGRFGLIVERLNKNMELAVKPAPEQLAHLRFLGGVSVLGDGRVALILNPENLL